MACLYPIPATRREAQGVITVALWPKGQAREDAPLALPCGRCVECRGQDKLAWALRCKLEADEHQHSTFATFTYETAPPQLRLRDLQLAYKRLRKDLAKDNRSMRHFSCGEYGTRNGRAHYHALLFGIHHEQDRELLETAWGLGRIETSPITTARIHYTVGYTTKKLGDIPEKPWWEDGAWERLDRDTGELTAGTYRNNITQPPFRIMSKRPGIGATGKQWRNAWRTHAVLEGKTIAVPRFLKQHWKDTATREEIEQRDYELQQRRQQQRARTTEDAHGYKEALDERDRHNKATEEIRAAQLESSGHRRQ